MSRLIQTRSETISSNNLQKISSDLDKKIVVIRLIDAIGFFLFENNRLTSVDVYDENYSVGHIIVGRVINVKKEISAVFISLSENTDAFCKLSNVPERYFPLHQGDLIPVKIIAEAQKGKRVSVTANISEKNIDPSWKYKSAFSNCGMANTLETFIKSNFTIDECKSLITDDSEIYDKLANVNCLTSSNISLYSDDKLPL